MTTPKERFDRFDRATDLPLAALALLIVAALVLEERTKSESSQNSVRGFDQQIVVGDGAALSASVVLNWRQRWGCDED